MDSRNASNASICSLRTEAVALRAATAADGELPLEAAQAGLAHENTYKAVLVMYLGIPLGREGRADGRKHEAEFNKAEERKQVRRRQKSKKVAIVGGAHAQEVRGNAHEDVKKGREVEESVR